MGENRVTNRLTPFVAASAVLHGGLFLAVLLVPSLIPTSAEPSWGTSTDKGVKVGVVSSLPGIPLPSPPVVMESAKPNASDTLNPPEPAPKPVAKAPPKAADIKIPARGAKPAAPRRDIPAGPVRAEPAPPAAAVASNAIPGAGGQIALPYGQPGAGDRQATFGDGSFGTRFPEYVNSMTRAIEVRWQDNISSIPRGASPRVYVTFVLNRAGKPTDLQVSESSGSTALDNSAQRAVLSAAIPPLPAAYSGSTVEVRFYFEYKR